ncbi:MAG: hypothetical protein HC822_18655 [Oscillochloris sp.]|nr:hypothetical protein [Oscillochloris sp.]
MRDHIDPRPAKAMSGEDLLGGVQDRLAHGLAVVDASVALGLVGHRAATIGHGCAGLQAPTQRDGGMIQATSPPMKPMEGQR